MPQAITEKVFHHRRFGMCLLLIAFKDATMNRSDSLVSFDMLGFGSYYKTLKHVLKTVGIKLLTTLFTAVCWDLANRGKNKRSGGISNHPFFDDVEGFPGFVMKNKLLASNKDRVEKWLDVLKSYAKKMEAKRKVYEKARRPRVRLGGKPKVRGLSHCIKLMHVFIVICVGALQKTCPVFLDSARNAQKRQARKDRKKKEEAGAGKETRKRTQAEMNAGPGHLNGGKGPCIKEQLNPGFRYKPMTKALFDDVKFKESSSIGTRMRIR